jgi:hypothetical protein
MTWGFCGRQAEIDTVTSILKRRRWFFARVTGRRRIGKTSLVQEALRRAGERDVCYVRIPDSAPAGVLSAVADAFETFGIDRHRFPPPTTLQGLYDVVLKFVARHPGCTNGDIESHVRSMSRDTAEQAAGYVKVLIDKYRMIEKRLPLFARPRARLGRYHVCDNYLRSWLCALASPVSAISFRPIDGLIAQAEERLREAEGHGLERLVAALHEERSRKGVGDFELTSRIEGYWDRGDIELDLVAENETERVVRIATCKRASTRLLASLAAHDGHVARFLEAHPRLADWRIEKVAIAPLLGAQERRAIRAAGYLPQDLADLTRGL